MPKKLTIVSCLRVAEGRFKVSKKMDATPWTLFGFYEHAVDTHNLNFTTKAEVCDVTDLLKDDYYWVACRI